MEVRFPYVHLDRINPFESEIVIDWLPVEVPEFRLDDCPVVARFDFLYRGSTFGDVECRHAEGRFYLRPPTLNFSPQEFGLTTIGTPEASIRTVRYLVDEMNDHWNHLDPAVYNEMATQLANALRGVPGPGYAARVSHRNCQYTQTEARRNASEIAERLTIIDGELWMEVPEPKLKVDIIHGVRGSHVFVLGVETVDADRLRADTQRSPTSRSLLRLDMVGHAYRLAETRRPLGEYDYVPARVPEIVDASAFRFDALDHLQRQTVSYTVEAYRADVGRMAADTAMMWMDLRDIDEALASGTLSTRDMDVDHAITRLLDTVPRDARKGKIERALDFAGTYPDVTDAAAPRVDFVL